MHISKEWFTNLSCPTSQSEDNSNKDSSPCSTMLIKTTNNEVNSCTASIKVTCGKVFPRRFAMGNHLDRWTSQAAREVISPSNACCMQNIPHTPPPPPPHPSSPRCAVMYPYTPAAAFFQAVMCNLDSSRVEEQMVRKDDEESGEEERFFFFI